MCLWLWATTLLFLYLLLMANIHINYCYLASIVSGCYCHGVLLYTVVCLLAIEDKISLRNVNITSCIAWCSPRCMSQKHSWTSSPAGINGANASSVLIILVSLLVNFCTHSLLYFVACLIAVSMAYSNVRPWSVHPFCMSSGHPYTEPMWQVFFCNHTHLLPHLDIACTLQQIPDFCTLSLQLFLCQYSIICVLSVTSACKVVC
jgi:hypothetical protein